MALKLQAFNFILNCAQAFVFVELIPFYIFHCSLHKGNLVERMYCGTCIYIRIMDLLGSH